MNTVTFALVGDIHAYSLWLWPHEWLGKRIQGQINLYLFRRRSFRFERWASQMQYMQAQQPDGLLLTGDLTTTALPREFAKAKQYLQPLLQQIDHGCVHAVPGNHDRYTQLADRQSRFESQVSSWAQVSPSRAPSIRPLAPSKLKHWHVVSVDGTQAVSVGAYGQIDTSDAEQLAQILDALPEQAGVVLMSHYPFAFPEDVQESDGHALRGRQHIVRVIEKYAKRLKIVHLHGHIHKPWHVAHTTQEGGVWYSLNAGAPVCDGSGYAQGQGMWTLSFSDEATAPVIAKHSSGCGQEIEHVFFEK